MLSVVDDFARWWLKVCQGDQFATDCELGKKKRC